MNFGFWVAFFVLGGTLFLNIELRKENSFYLIYLIINFLKEIFICFEKQTDL